MKITTLHIENFLTLPQAQINLDGRGLNVLQGKNDGDSSASSNGAGKSSIVDALCWALFGVTARGVKGDAVINLAAKKNCRVRVHIVHGDVEYIVIRHRKDSEHKNALLLYQRTPVGDVGAAPHNISKGTDAETQKEVERILGCSLEVFVSAVYLGQEQMPDLPRMTDRELKRLIEEAAGLQRIEMAYEEARSRRSTAASRLDVNCTTQDNVKARIARDEASLAVKRTHAADFEATRAERVAAAKERVTEAQAMVDALRERVRHLTPQVEADRARRAELDVQMANYAQLDREARAAETASTKASSGIRKDLLISARETVATIEAQIANVDEALAEPCGECGKPHTEADREKYLKHRQKRLEDARANLALVEQSLREQVEAAKRLVAAANEARAKVPDVSAASAELTEIATRTRVVEKLIADVKFSGGELMAAQSALAMRETEPNPHQAVVESLQQSIADEATGLAALKTEHEALAKAVSVAEAVVKVFGPAGVRAHILDTVTPFLNDRTSDYLSVLSDGNITARWTTLTKGASGDLKEKFSIDVANLVGGDSFSALSGGEKRKVRLACALALQDLVASRAANPIDLWVADEVDDALDTAGLERLMVIMEKRARDRGTVVMISHNDLADWCDQVTTVTKKDKFMSEVEGALCV